MEPVCVIHRVIIPTHMAHQFLLQSPQRSIRGRSSQLINLFRKLEPFPDARLAGVTYGDGCCRHPLTTTICQPTLFCLLASSVLTCR